MAEADKGPAQMMDFLMTGMGALCKAFYEKYGDEALPLIAEVSSQGAEKYVKIMQQMAPVKSMKTVGEMYKMMGPILETVELSDDVFHFTMSSCPMGLEGTSKELCEALMTTDYKAMNTFLGKDVDMKIIKSIAAGDEVCEVIISVK